MPQENFFEFFGKLFLTRKQAQDLEKKLHAAGIILAPEAFAGYLTLNILIVAILLTLLFINVQDIYSGLSDAIYSVIPGMPQAVIIIALFVIALIVAYIGAWIVLSSYLVLRAEGRRNKVEAALPDFLMLVSANIKAGMPLDQAMWYSAKPEFGLLSVEVKSTIKHAFGGESLNHSLDELSMRFDSKVMKRTIALIKQALATGGEVAAVLETTASDVRGTRILKKEIAASLVLYEIFVLFAAMVGTPFLFAVGEKLVEVFEMQRLAMPIERGGGFTQFSSLTFAEPIITSGDFYYFSLATIFVTSLISSFIVSVIRTGTKSEGMKYFPFVVAVSYGIFFAVSHFLETFFANI